MKIKIAGIVNDSIVDGPGLRLAVFTQGCPHNCPGCHNPETHDPAGGCETDTEEILNSIRENPLLDGITISGGEPFLQSAPLAHLCEKIKTLGLHTMAYTGYTWEEISKNPEMLAFAQNLDLIVDGRFVLKERTLDLRFRGSKNQRIIDVKKSLAESRAIIAEL